MSSPISIVAALSPIEASEFFPDAALSELKALSPQLHLVDPTGLSDEAWRTMLFDLQPDVLIACWTTPSLPDPAPASLRYACYVAGSVKKFVTRAHLERGLIVTNWGTSISRVVAECGLLLMLATLRRATHWALALHRDGGWKTRTTRFESLFGRRIGIHGFGAIAQELVRLLQPFDVKVASFAPQAPDLLLTKHGVDRAATLETLFSQNDVIVELAPLIPENHHIVGETLLRLIPEGGVFVNIGRGALVDEKAIVVLAQEGRLHFGLDVFETEPLPVDHPFRGLANVTMLPHFGGPTTDRRVDAGTLAARNVRAFLAGTPLEAVVTTEIFDQST